MHRTIIADTSCLIVLSNINELELLQKVYGEIITTFEVAKEFNDILPSWIKIAAVKDLSKISLLEIQLDRGESSAIALALETSDCIIILDDIKARNVAKQLGLQITGTIGVITKAKLLGLLPSIKPLLEKIKQTNFRLSRDIELQALIEAKEN